MNLISQDAIDVERWRRIESVLDAALELAPHDVAAYLDRACVGSPELRREVEDLLDADRRATEFMAVPAAERVNPFATAVRDAGDTRAEARPETVTDPAPARVGRYVVAGELGRGGMGIVYLGRDEGRAREVAIKALPSSVETDPVRLARMLREAKLLGTLHHPNIGRILGLEHATGRRYLVLERIEGETLADRLRAGALPIRDALDACAQVAEALAAAHEQGIVHRDLKPSNVMLTPTGLAKVLDFGLATHVSGGDAPGITPAETSSLGPAAADPLTRAFERTGAAGRLGTPGYMSPEQVLGLRQDARSDLFALGAVLYQCLTGHRAFAGATTYALIAATLHAQPDASCLPADTPESVRGLLARTLEKDPTRRLADAGTAAAILAAAARPRGGRRPGALARTSGAPAAAGARVPLPEPDTTFIGREREIAAALGLLDRARLVTLVGPGGCGKTRLAIEVARAAHRADRPVLGFADLAAATDATAVAAAIAAAVDVRDASEARLPDALAALLAGTGGVLVLDNCDRVLAASASLATRLLARCPALRVLATSREWLGALNEQTLRVPPLSLPDPESPTTPDAVGASEAVRLFVACAGAVPSGFRLTAANAERVAGICRNLDGVPLAIELTAALLRQQSLEDIAHDLERRVRLGPAAGDGPHPDALPAVMELSYERLTEDERGFFRALSAFTGGWTLEAATAVCREDHDDFAALDLLTRLADKSLVAIQRAERVEPRYRLLEPIRHFAAVRCESADEATRLRERHLEWFLAAAERAAPSLLSGSHQAHSLAALEADHPNLLAALHACEASPGGGAKALRLAGSVWLFWYIRGHFARGREALDRALRLPGADAPTPARAQALFAAGGLALFQGEFGEGRRLSQAALELYEALGDRMGVARSVSHLALCESGEGRYDEARDAYQRAIDLFRDTGDARRLSAALNNQGVLWRQLGDFRAARANHAEALELLRRADDRDGMIVTLVNLALASIRLGDNDAAVRWVDEALAHVQELRAKRAAAAALEVAADVLAVRGHPEEGARLLGSATALRSGMGLAADEWWRRHQLELSERLRGALGADRFTRRTAEGGARSFEQAVDDARRAITASVEEAPVAPPKASRTIEADPSGPRSGGLP